MSRLGLGAESVFGTGAALMVMEGLGELMNALSVVRWGVCRKKAQAGRASQAFPVSR
jgi:hypothetical protein